MKLQYGNMEIVCDRVTETDGKLSIWQGGEIVREISNIPSTMEYTPIDGLIEHILTPLEEALENINDLQADLAAAAVEIAEQAQAIKDWEYDYMEVLADDEAKKARLDRIEALVSTIGETPTLSGLLTFLRNLKDILSEVGNGAA